MYKFRLNKNVLYRIICALLVFTLSLTLSISNSSQNASAEVYGANSQSVRKLLQEEKELLRGHTFTVGYNEDHKPFQYTDENGQAAGTVVAMLDSLAEQYGFNIQYKLYDNQNAVNANYDIIIATLASLEALSLKYVPTISYHDERLMMVFKKHLSINDIKDKEHSIALLEYPLTSKELLKEYPKAIFSFYEASNALLEAYDENIIDAALFSRTLIDASMFGQTAFIREYYNEQNVVLASDIEVPQRFFISDALSKQYLPIFNAILSEISYSTLLYDAEPHLEKLPFSAPSYFALEKTLMIVALVCLVIVAFFFVRKFKRKSEVTEEENIEQAYSESSIIPYPVFSSEIEKKLPEINPNEYELIGLDIDLFKLIVSYYGHEIAEKLIHTMSDLLESFYASEDVLITRYNSDYFLIFRKKTDEGQAIKKFVEEVLTPSFKETTGQHYAVSFSVGTYIVKDTKISLTDMITFSELARRQGKNIHTSTFYTFDEVLSKQYHDKLNITYRMNSALENKEFVVEYQPKIDLKKFKVTGAEALVRWYPPVGDKIYPIDFIPVFEKNGFISKLDVYVYSEVCKFIQENRKLCAEIKIACNLSPVTLAKADIVDEIVNITKQHSINPSKIEFEIVESVIDDIPLSELIKKLNALRHFGFSIALDDFGAGASSLNRFGLLPIDVVKLDKKFIDNIENERMAYTVKNFISSTRELNLITVAEGVETKEQVQWVKEANCDIAQGFLFSRPQTQEDFIDTLRADFLYLQ